MVWVVGIGVFLFLLFAFPRPMMGLIALCGLAVGGFLLFTKIENQNRARERASISITISYDFGSVRAGVPVVRRDSEQVQENT